MNWEPAHADHSIDQVLALASIEPALDPDSFDEMVVAVRKVANAHGFTDRFDQQEPFFPTPPLNTGQGMVINFGSDIPMRRRVTYRQLAEGAVVGEFAVGATTIALSTTRYRRWANFSKTFNDLVQNLDATAHIVSKVKSIRLQYVDRFQSTPGGADHFEVLSRSSSFLVDSVRQVEAAFHVHSGWFDLSEQNTRMLTNVNIDVNDLSGTAPPDMRKQLSIMCLGQIEALTGVLTDPVERLEYLHLYLKNLFGQIISAEAADRVALNPDANAHSN